FGDPLASIAKDHLRILRYYRFQARFGDELDQEAETACAEMADTLKGLSRERIADELLKLLSLPDPAPTAARMFERGVLRVILPETCTAHVKALAALVVQEAAQDEPPAPLRRLAALLPPSAEVAESVAARLRLSKNQRARLVSAAERQDEDCAHPQSLAYRISVAFAVDRLLLLGAPIDAVRGWEPPRFPLKGGVIVARGVAAGPEVARILQMIERRWVSEGFPGEERIEELLTQALLER
ncbi:MAG: CCA tRNA nucleotidyltransferase, partial [Pseudomonadota bacterium]